MLQEVRSCFLFVVQNQLRFCAYVVKHYLFNILAPYIVVVAIEFAEPRVIAANIVVANTLFGVCFGRFQVLLSELHFAAAVGAEHKSR